MRRLYGEGEPDPDNQEEDDIEETIKASLRNVQVEQEEDRQECYELFVGLQLSQPYKGEWREIRKFLGSLK